jgi:hypothetical protein
MASASKFEKHLFISYAHMDNQPLTPEQQGWISRFHASLSLMLSMRLGHPAEIWRDQKLSGNDVFADEIVSQFPKTALLISILTPRYLESDWCTREVKEFSKAAEHSGGLTIGNKSRIIKVIKTPVDNEGPLPPVMKELLGYPFYIFDEEHTPLELDPAFGADMTQKYNLKIAKLAWDITQQIKELEATTPAPGSGKPTIYLAECSWDQRQARENLEAELRTTGYPIIPDRELPRDEEGYVAEVTKLLGQSALSIHLVGAAYGAVPDGPTQKSISVLQNELAVGQSKSRGLKRVIWVPDGIEAVQLEQQRFVETLHTSPDAQFGADLIVGDLEAFKSAVHAALEKLEKQESPPSIPIPGEILVYLICDERDRKDTIPLRKYLRNQELAVKIPVFEGDAATVQKSNQDMLTQCDLIIVYYGAGDELWKHTVDSDLRKMKGYRGEKPLLATYTYLGEPVTDDKKEMIEMEEPDVIDGLAGFPETAMQALIKRLKAAGSDERS